MPRSPNDAFEAWRRAGHRHDHRGRSIFYRIEGEGPPLVAIHGFPSASWDWYPIWRRLVARFRVVAPDLIGFGWSEKPRHYDYSIRDQASLVEGLLGELGIDRVHVLAHDYGASVAQELLARDDERAGSPSRGLALQSVCFLNGGLFPEAHRALPIQKLLASRVGGLVAPFISRGGFARSLRHIFGRSTPPSRELVDELWTLLEHDHGRRVVPKLLGYIEERRAQRARWVGVLAKTRVPLVFVNGGADPVSGAHMVERYRAFVPNAEAVVLDRIGHYPQVEAPDEVARAFLAFHDRLAT